MSSTAVALNTVGTAGVTVIVENTDATATNTIDLGPSTVTAGAGYPLLGGAVMRVEVDPGDQLFAIRSTANDVIVGILRT